MRLVIEVFSVLLLMESRRINQNKCFHNKLTSLLYTLLQPTKDIHCFENA